MGQYYRGGATNHTPPFGSIVGDAGLYGPTAGIDPTTGNGGVPSVNWDPNAPSVTVLHTPSATTADQNLITHYENCFSDQLTRITNAHIGYALTGPNSNTADTFG